MCARIWGSKKVNNYYWFCVLGVNFLKRNMDNEELMQQYGSLLGENVDYVGSDDEERSGRLVTIAVNKDTDEPEAHIRVS